MKDKVEIRNYIKQLKKNLTMDEVRERSHHIAVNFFSQQCYKDAENIYLYVSYNQEVDTKFMINKVLKDGKRVAVPRVIDEVMEFHEITNLNQLSVGAFGILEPNVENLVSNDPVWKTKNIMIVPGLAFDKQGGRIGYGGGYYDRYIQKYRDQIQLKLALAYDFQVFEHIETESFDENIDGIITDKIGYGVILNHYKQPNVLELSY